MSTPLTREAKLIHALHIHTVDPTLVQIDEEDEVIPVGMETVQ